MTSRRTRVLIAIQNFGGGGAERVPLTLAGHLDPASFEVTVFAHERWGPLFGSTPPHVRVVAEYDVYRRHHIPALLAQSIRLARDHDVLVGANEGRVATLALLAGRAVRKPVACWIHTDWEEFGKRTSWRQRWALPLYGRADAVVAVSHGVAASFARLARLDPQGVRVIYNGVPGDEIRRLALEPIPPEHESAFSAPAVVNVGRLDEVKGQRFLLEAHANLCARGVRHHLILVGDGPDHRALRVLAARMGVAKTVFFMGFQANPYRYVRRASVFALSSLLEGLGLVLAEAMFCGAPVVSFDCPTGPREVLAGGRYGVLIPARDTAALTAAIASLLASPDERARYAARSLERAPSFDVQCFVHHWAKLLRVLCGSRYAGNRSSTAPSR